MTPHCPPLAWRQPRLLFAVTGEYNSDELPGEQPMTRIELRSKVDADGVLTLKVALGPAEANQEVLVTVQAAEKSLSGPAGKDWHSFVERTYGSCADHGLEEPPDLPVQQRAWTS
jgi:hypothetical protein